MRTSTTAVKPSPATARIPKPKKIAEPISPKAPENSAGASRPRCNCGSLRAMRGGYSRRRTSPPAQKRHAGDPGAHEERAEHEPDRAAAVHRRHHDERDPDPDERDREEGDARAVEAHAAFGVAVTLTRHGACFSTKSTVSPKIAPPACPRP